MYDIKERNIETVYTLEDARKIIKAQDLKMANYRKEKMINKLVQKLVGLLFIILGCLAPVVLDGDATVSIIAVPLGINLLFISKNILNL